MTNKHPLDKSLGFSVITLNRPFHLFAEDLNTRSFFLSAFTSIITPHEHCVVHIRKNKHKPNIKIVSYKEGSVKEDTKAINRKVNRSAFKSIHTNTTDPFAILDTTTPQRTNKSFHRRAYKRNLKASLMKENKLL